jgi:hypothetical protein
MHRTAADQLGQLVAGVEPAGPRVGLIVDAELIELRRIDAVEMIDGIAKLERVAIPDDRARGFSRSRRHEKAERTCQTQRLSQSHIIQSPQSDWTPPTSSITAPCHRTNALRAFDVRSGLPLSSPPATALAPHADILTARSKTRQQKGEACGNEPSRRCPDYWRRGLGCCRGLVSG